MEIKQIRYKNLLRIRDEHAHGNWTELANAIGSAPNYFYQLKPEGKRGLGPQLARRIEGAFNKPKGWMDSLHDKMPDAESYKVEDGSGKYASELSAPSIDRELLARCISEVESFLLEMDGAFKSKPTAGQKASAITALYINRAANPDESIASSDVAAVFALLVSNSGA